MESTHVFWKKSCLIVSMWSVFNLPPEKKKILLSDLLRIFLNKLKATYLTSRLFGPETLKRIHVVDFLAFFMCCEMSIKFSWCFSGFHTWWWNFRYNKNLSMQILYITQSKKHIFTNNLMSYFCQSTFIFFFLVLTLVMDVSSFMHYMKTTLITLTLLKPFNL